jgi:NADH:ubiquinone oxidoreductase subunit 2 (subunit N)
MQNEKGRMMKPAYSTILHSSFILLNFPVPASHYVKVMLDQVFKLKNQIPLAINNQL